MLINRRTSVCAQQNSSGFQTLYVQDLSARQLIWRPCYKPLTLDRPDALWPVQPVMNSTTIPEETTGTKFSCEPTTALCNLRNSTPKSLNPQTLQASAHASFLQPETSRSVTASKKRTHRSTPSKPSDPLCKNLENTVLYTSNSTSSTPNCWGG